MNTFEVAEIGRDLLTTAIWMAGPPIFVSLIVGLIVSLAQTVTSIQEQTLSFAPRILAVGLVMLVMLPWMLQTSSAFTIRMVQRMMEITQ
jgi:flagellar biosynthesis protein FliQ